MSIFPLPVFEADSDPRYRSARSDEEIYDALEPPRTMVVRFGAMKLVGEFPYDGDAKPGCGTKVVVRTHRGTEVGEMLTTTCENAGCSKSVTRKELLDYVERSGGKDYPFHTKGRVMRVATVDDLNAQSELDASKSQWVKPAKAAIAELELDMRLVDVEPILGGEVLTLYYTAEERVDFRELVQQLASAFSARIEMKQVGARDEARLVADYERCGQYCCCKNFLKVLKPVSMGAAKMQKATLDPLKISGRCGRLMCCLRYEDQSYRELKQNLPNRKSRVGTPHGPGLVLDGKILVQLVLVRLEHDGSEVAVPVEDLSDPETCPRPGEDAGGGDPLRGMDEGEVVRRQGRTKRDGETPPERRRKRKRRRGGSGKEDAGAGKARGGDGPGDRGGDESDEKDGTPDTPGPPGTPGEPGSGRRRRRRRGGRRSGGGDGKGSGSGGPKGGPKGGGTADGGGGSGKRRRRRRRRGGSGGGDGGGGSGGD